MFTSLSKNILFLSCVFMYLCTYIYFQDVEESVGDAAEFRVPVKLRVTSSAVRVKMLINKFEVKK